MLCRKNEYFIYLLILGQLLECLSFDMTNKTYTQIKLHNVWKYLDQFECGESYTDKIIGGNNARLGQFPWIARLGYKSFENGIEFRCGGAVISPFYVLTAGHCVAKLSDDVELVLVRLGEHNQFTDPDCENGVCAPTIQDIRIHEVIVHNSFDRPHYSNDIAMLRLKNKANFNDYVLPICLPRDELLHESLKGEKITVAGWGVTNMTTADYAQILQYIHLNVLESELCAQNQEFEIHKSQFCAGGGINKDSCSGDSGGPAMKVYDVGDTGPKTYLMGIVSFGPEICGTSNQPGIYSLVSHYMTWILDKIKKK